MGLCASYILNKSKNQSAMGNLPRTFEAVWDRRSLEAALRGRRAGLREEGPGLRGGREPARERGQPSRAHLFGCRYTSFADSRIVFGL